MHYTSDSKENKDGQIDFKRMFRNDGGPSGTDDFFQKEERALGSMRDSQSIQNTQVDHLSEVLVEGILKVYRIRR
jgi:hypothetical protein